MRANRSRNFFRKTIASFVLAVATIASVFCCNRLPVHAAPIALSGSGSVQDPYLIQTMQDLTTFRNAVNGGVNFKGYYFKQTADIDLSLISSFTPIGTDNTSFAGNYDGAGHVISNLNIKAEKFASLFLNILGTVRNLGIEGGTIKGEVANSITSSGSAESKLLNCYSTATVVGSVRSGGLVDNFDGVMMNCWYYNADAKIPMISTDAKSVYYSYAQNLAPSTAKGKFVECQKISASYFKKPEFVDQLNLGRAITLSTQYMSEKEIVRWKGATYPAFTEDLPLWTGSGSKKDPYLIESVEDLVMLAVRVNSGENYEMRLFRQTKDLDLKHVYNFVPIGMFDSNRYFAGVYDGYAHTLSNLTILSTKESYNNALFGQLSGTVRNLGVESGDIYGANCATFASHSAHPKALILNCYSKANVWADSRSGGIVDNFGGSVRACMYLNFAQPLTYLCSYDATLIDASYSTGALYNSATMHKLEEKLKNEPAILTNYGEVKYYVGVLNSTIGKYAADYHIAYSDMAEWELDENYNLHFKGCFDEEKLPDDIQSIIDKHYSDQLIIIKMVLVIVVVIIFTIVVDILLFRYRKERIDRQRRGR